MSTELPTNCNQCDNKCPREELRCRRGMAYFKRLENGEQELQSENKLVMLLSQSGSLVSHRSRMMQAHGEDEEKLFSGLEPEERQQLEALLDKLYQGWQKEHAQRHANGHPHGMGGHPEHGDHHGHPGGGDHHGPDGHPGHGPEGRGPEEHPEQ